MDLSKEYWQISVSGDDVKKTAFVTPDGCYKFLRMSFEIKHLGATLVQGMRHFLSDMDNGDNYIDDVIVYAKDWESHVATLKELFNQLQEASFTAKLKKCLIGPKTMDFFGFAIDENGITINDENLEKIRNSQRPTTKKEVRSFLGLANYYRDPCAVIFCNFGPFEQFDQKGQPSLVRWGEALDKHSITLQEILHRKPVLRLPDHEKTFLCELMH